MLRDLLVVPYSGPDEEMWAPLADALRLQEVPRGCDGYVVLHVPGQLAASELPARGGGAALSMFVGRDTTLLEVAPCQAAELAHVLQMLYHTVTEAPGRRVQVSVPVRMRFLAEIVRYLAANGFRQAASAGARETVTLVLDKERPAAGAQCDTLQDVMDTRAAWLRETPVQRFDVVIPRAVASALRDFLARGHEVAGRLALASEHAEYCDGLYVPVAVLGLAPEGVQHGTESSVRVPPGFFNFHTHPTASYVRYGAVYGFPSAQDLCAWILSRSMYTNIVHFVVTAEGVYALQLTPDFGLYIDELEMLNPATYRDCVEHMFDRLRRFLFAVENSHSVQHVVERLNTVRVRELADAADCGACEWAVPAYDFSIFQVDLVPWDRIGAGGGLRIRVAQVFRPAIICCTNK